MCIKGVCQCVSNVKMCISPKVAEAAWENQAGGRLSPSQDLLEICSSLESQELAPE